MQQETIKASEFKAKCLQLMDEVKQTGKEIIITKNGEPVSKLVPVRERPRSLFGAHKDEIKIKEAMAKLGLPMGDSTLGNKN